MALKDAKKKLNGKGKLEDRAERHDFDFCYSFPLKKEG